MTPDRLLKTSITPALDELAALGIPSSQSAARFMLAIALQESGLAHRRQLSAGIEQGPASSFWQAEQGGACRGVIAHPTVGPIMAKICEAYNVQANAAALWEAIRYQDIVAACLARTLIYTLPSKLPETAAEGWQQYLSAWRPGKPRPDDWENNWAQASQVVGV